MMTHLGTFAIMIAALTTLTALPATAGSIADDDLVGTWDWVQTIAGFAGITTPETEGYTQTLVLRVDGTYDLLRNDALHQSGAWDLSDLSSVCGSDQSLWMEALTPERSRVDLAQNVLLFGMLCLDGSDYTFERRTEVGTQTSSWSAMKNSAARGGDR